MRIISNYSNVSKHLKNNTTTKDIQIPTTFTQVRELTTKQQTFLKVLFAEAEGDYTRAKQIAGYSETTSPSEVLRSVKDEVLELTKEYLAMNAPRAARAMINVLDRRLVHALAVLAVCLFLLLFGLLCCVWSFVLIWALLTRLALWFFLFSPSF